jgi:hypothetical protein
MDEPTTRTFIFSLLAAALRQMGKAGLPASRDFSCRFKCCRGCSEAYSCITWKRRSPQAI